MLRGYARCEAALADVNGARGLLVERRRLHRALRAVARAQDNPDQVLFPG
jgi:hypothetical protein